MKTLWKTLLAYTTDPKNTNYIRYGRKGIRLCDEWLDFKTFCKEVGPKPEGVGILKVSIRRYDVKLNFSKANCYWHIQNKNEEATKVPIGPKPAPCESRTIDKNHTKLGHIVCQVRTQRNLTLSQAAEKLGWTARKLRKVEQGFYLLSLLDLFSMSDFTNLTPSQIMAQL